MDTRNDDELRFSECLDGHANLLKKSPVRVKRAVDSFLDPSRPASN
jgi:hypothetical protein